MTALIVLFASAVIGQAPRLMDGYLINWSSVSAKADFVYATGVVDYSTLADGQLWDNADLASTWPSKNLIHSTWEKDATTERFVFDVPNHPREHELTPKDLHYEALVTSDSYIFRKGDSKSANAASGKAMPFKSLLKGPFMVFSDRLPQFVEQHFVGIKPDCHKSIRGGYPVDVEVYRKEVSRENGWAQLEIAYDSSVGFLPRHARSVVYSGKNDAVSVIEHFLLQARPCRSGGFVPMEHVEVWVNIKDFSKQYPEYSSETTFKNVGKVSVSRFAISKVEDSTTPVSLASQSIRTLNTPGGRIRLRGGKSAPLSGTISLPEVSSIAGDRLSKPLPKRLAQFRVDSEELSKHEQTPTNSSFVVMCSGLTVGVTSLLLWYWLRKRRVGVCLVVAILGTLSVAGCGKTPLSVKLSASFEPSRLLIDSSEPDPSLILAVLSQSTQPIKVLRIEGGCTCRKVDQSVLPLVIKPGQQYRFNVNIQRQDYYHPKKMSFDFHTEQGTFSVAASLLLLPHDHLSPESLIAYLDSEESAQLEIVHRNVFKTDEIESGIYLQAPSNMSLAVIGKAAGHVPGAPEFSYQDTTYRVSIRDPSLGTHKAQLSLRDPKTDRTLIEAPVLWVRRPFMYSLPDRVNLGPKAVRVFLQCRDHDVELTKVVATPVGVSAIVSSPRELTVKLNEDASDIINGAIEVGTSAEGHPPLKIPVVRYNARTGQKVGK